VVGDSVCGERREEGRKKRMEVGREKKKEGVSNGVEVLSEE